MHAMFIHIRKLDWIIVFTSIFLTGLGILSIYSSSLGRADFGNVQKQIIFLLIGIGLLFIISFFDYRLLRNDPYFILLLYIIGVIALAGLLLFAPEIRGVKGWYRIGSISIDPIEYMKLVLIILMAKYFSLRHIEVYRIRHIVLTGIYFFIPISLIAFQPDLGPVVILMLLWMVTLLLSGVKLRHFLILVLVGVILFSLGWSVFLLDHQKNRILSFLEPELDPLGIGWSQEQSRIAIGNGVLTGQGFGNGTQTQYGFLSEPQTDFIFAAIAEEFGLFGVTLLFILMGILLWRVLRIGYYATSNFSRLFAAGFAILLISQTFVNVGMNLGLLPIIGISLPFISYGGSSLIFTYIGLGILQSIHSRR